MFILKPFQEEAITRLRKSFLELWKTGNYKIPLVFKSPTGSGKTIMMAQFLKDLTGDPQFDVDKAFLWFSFNEESYEQSKKKLFNYYGGASEIDLLDLNDLNRGKLEKNNIFFINWDKIKSSTKEGRVLRRDNEQGLSFDNFIKSTQRDERELILIVDEAHRDRETDLADELIKLINPKIIIEVTATPKNEQEIKSKAFDQKAGFVEIDKQDVIEAGLIKEKIVSQTKKDLDRLSKKDLDQDLLLLELAYQKRLELKKQYEKLGKDINPLVLIQLPNDDKSVRETLIETKLEIIKSFLRDKNVDDSRISIWLSEKKENLDLIEKNNSPVEFLIFKQAAATGWYCPRADILLMFREIKTPIFHTQTLGRILRMPEAMHYSVPELNLSYLYTNYDRNHIVDESSKLGDNRPAIYDSYRKSQVKPFSINSIYMSRTDYNDLGDSFQHTFKEVADKFFKIKKEDSAQVRKSKIAKEIDINDLSVKNTLIIGAEIEDYDNFVNNIKESGEDLSLESSRNDLERLYKLICFNIISQQEDEDRKFAPERSWSRVKTALNVYFANNLKLKRFEYYKLIVKELLKEDSKLRVILSEALYQYRPIREIEVQKKAHRASRKIKLDIPPNHLKFTDEYTEMSVKKSALEPFYIKKEYLGSVNEIRFIKYLEAKKNIEWWYKNGDYGSEFFSIPYYNKQEKKEKMFYPDWIVRTHNKLLFLETKAGDTVESLDTKYKGEALYRWLKNQKHGFVGGIVVQDGTIWKINSEEEYNPDRNNKSWKNLDAYFY